MAVNRDVKDFIELRQGFLGMRDFADAALGFMDRNGIGVIGVARKAAIEAFGGRRAKPVPLERIREEVKRRYTRRMPLAATAAPTPKLPAKDRILQQRQATATLLAQFDTTESRKVTSPMNGVLVRRGYIKKKGDGYVRTAKEFVVTPPSKHKAKTTPASLVNAGVNGHSASLASPSRITIAEAAGLLKLTENGVRSLVDRKTLKGYKEPRLRRGFKKPAITLVMDRDAVVQLAAERAAN